MVRRSTRRDGKGEREVDGEEGGGHSEGAPGSFSVSFGIPSEEETPAEEQSSESEGDQDKPNKHRAKHASEYHVDHFHFYHGVLLCVGG